MMTGYTNFNIKWINYKVYTVQWWTKPTPHGWCMTVCTVTACISSELVWLKSINCVLACNLKTEDAKWWEGGFALRQNGGESCAALCIRNRMYIICVECSTSRAPGMEWGDRAGSFMMRKDWEFYDADVTLVNQQFSWWRRCTRGHWSCNSAHWYYKHSMTGVLLPLTTILVCNKCQQGSHWLGLFTCLTVREMWTPSRLQWRLLWCTLDTRAGLPPPTTHPHIPPP